MRGESGEDRGLKEPDHQDNQQDDINQRVNPIQDVDHRWLLSDREGYQYYRDGQAVGYGYLEVRNRPFALLDTNDFPTVLAHAESQAAAQGRCEFGLELPMVNQVAVDYLLGREFMIHGFVAIMMNDHPMAKFENYILTSPPFFL